MLIAVMAVFEEEALIERAIGSLKKGGVQRIHVFDGAWEGFERRRDDEGWSLDGTMEVAANLGCNTHFPSDVWPNQETKRTAMFQQCGATTNDHIFVFDADEELEGTFPFPLARGQHYNVQVKCVGENDMPGIRGEWPFGDYSPNYKPELRVFAYDEILHCKWPGGYWDAEGRIEPYANSAGDPLLPVLNGVSFLHHGNDRTADRRAAKLAFYEREHPRRAQVQEIEWQKQPW